jgi:hypothetical protein
MAWSKALEEAMDDRLSEVPEIIAIKAMQDLEEKMSANSLVGGMGGPYAMQVPGNVTGLFGDLVTRVWRVTGLAVHDNGIGGERFSATVVQASEDIGPYPMTRQFEVTEDEYEALNIGSLVHVTLAFE